jgi:23S rRNA pseudouridine2605 synthase
VRLQKYLSRSGVASRRHAEAMMAEGRVRVNGEVAREMGTTVDPERDVVEVDGRRVSMSAPVWLALHKPPGYITTRRDPGGRATIYDLLPREHHGLFYVGRLDYESEGLVLLTNQGDLANSLLHPSHEVERVYEVVVEGRPDSAAEKRLRFGVQLEDGIARVARLDRIGRETGHATKLRVVMLEGRKREVRRLFDAVGHPVRRLLRVGFGPVKLDELAAGAWRLLSDAEVRALARLAGESGER